MSPVPDAWVVFTSALGPERSIAINPFLVDGVFTKAGPMPNDDVAVDVHTQALMNALTGDQLLMGNEEAMIPKPHPMGSRVRRPKKFTTPPHSVNKNVTVLWYRASINEHTSHAEIFVKHDFAEVMMKLAAAKGAAHGPSEENPRQQAQDRSEPQG